MPEMIWIEPEYIERATAVSHRKTNEFQQWQVYLNTLALLSLEEWLGERIPDSLIDRDNANYLKVGDFKICVIATENLLNETVNIPQAVLDRLELAAHLYVILEVLEEEEQVIIRGFQRYDRLINYRTQVDLPVPDSCYSFPLSVFDAEPNHLLGICHYLDASAITLPVRERALNQDRTILSRWLQEIVDEGWQTLDALINSKVNLALSTRNIFLKTGTKAGKLINLGMQLGSQTVAMLITVTQEAEEKIGISLQIYPTGGESYLPPDLQLTLLSKAGKVLQQVRSRSQDNYIQLKTFKGEIGKRFSVEISLGDANVTEEFEL